MRRVIGAMALVVPLAGCGLPTPVSIASFVLDIGSYAVSGKTTTDHAMSALTGEDCAVIRVLEGDPCSSPEDYQLALGVLEPLADEAEGAPPPAAPTPLTGLQIAAVGVADLDAGAGAGFVAEGVGLAAFLSDDAAPGLAQVARPPSLALEQVGFVSDDIRPDAGAASPAMAPQFGAVRAGGVLDG